MSKKYFTYGKLQIGDIFRCSVFNDSIVGIVVSQQKNFLCIASNTQAWYKIGKFYNHMPFNYSRLEIISK